MRLFKINKKYDILCESEKTRYGFCHLATLLWFGAERAKAKCCYYNRTWESFEFESVMEKLADVPKLDDDERKMIRRFVKKGA